MISLKEKILNLKSTFSQIRLDNVQANLTDLSIWRENWSSVTSNNKTPENGHLNSTQFNTLTILKLLETIFKSLSSVFSIRQLEIKHYVTLSVYLNEYCF